MATFNKNIHGGFHGKLGHVVGYELHGKWVMRSLPRPSQKNKKGTAAQQACRTGFTQMQHFLKPLIEVIRIGFNLEAKYRMMTAHNVAKSHNMRHAQHSDGTIDCARVCLSYGQLSGAENPMVRIGENAFHFSWADKLNDPKAKPTDQVMIIAYHPESGGAYYNLSGAKRKNCAEVLPIPLHEKGKSFHVWLSFIADDRKNIAMSTYLGNFVF